jgi:hypothetical protein
MMMATRSVFPEEGRTGAGADGRTGFRVEERMDNDFGSCRYFPRLGRRLGAIIMVAASVAMSVSACSTVSVGKEFSGTLDSGDDVSTTYYGGDTYRYYREFYDISVTSGKTYTVTLDVPGKTVWFMDCDGGMLYESGSASGTDEIGMSGGSKTFTWIPAKNVVTVELSTEAYDSNPYSLLIE